MQHMVKAKVPLTSMKEPENRNGNHSTQLQAKLEYKSKFRAHFEYF